MERKKISIIFSLKDNVRDLTNALQTVEAVSPEQEVKILHIESRRNDKKSHVDIFLDLLADDDFLAKVKDQLQEKVAKLSILSSHPYLTEMPHKNDVTWFPRKISDLDKVANNLTIIDDSEMDFKYPSFQDQNYKERRQVFEEAAKRYKHGMPLPTIVYTDQENKTWSTIYREITRLYSTHACTEYKTNFSLLVQNSIYKEDALPNMNDVSNFLKEKSGFRLRPVAGFLSPRDFLAGLAFRVFFCTQYIRHHSEPFYTQEPDCCHELLGHVPMFADRAFAQFSQDIGLASLGATDEDITKLSRLYICVIEFGLCEEGGAIKALGAGILSSVNELKHVLTDSAVKTPFDLSKIVESKPNYTMYQDEYFFVKSLDQAKDIMRYFARNIKRPFSVRYDPYTDSIDVLDTPASIVKVINKTQQEHSDVCDALMKMQEVNNY